MKLEFTPAALSAYKQIKASSPELAERIKVLLKDALLHPESGKGEPVPLEGRFKGIWQRRISYNEYISYAFDDDTLLVASLTVNKSDATGGGTTKFDFGEYSEDEYRSVMDLMSSNRGKDSEPKVGIFWYNRATNALFGIVSHRISDYSKANASDGRITCSEMHEDVWKKAYYKQRYEHAGQGSYIGAYQDKPRGRVFYNIETDTYEVAVGKWLEEYPQAYELILKEFDLPPDKTVAKYAVHWDIGMCWR